MNILSRLGNLATALFKLCSENILNILSRFTHEYIIENINGYETIIFGDRFSTPLTNYHLGLISKIKHVGFRDNFTPYLDNLPNNIESIIFDYTCSYNYPLINLPLGIKELIINSYYMKNYEFVNYLPHGLIKLKLGRHFADELNNLPETLKHLDLHETSLSIETLNNLPRGLKTLKLPKLYKAILDNLPEGLEELCLYIKYPEDLKIELASRYPNLNITEYTYTDYGSLILENLQEQ